MRHATSWIERERERSEKQRGEAREEKKRRRNRSVRGWNRGESRYSEARDTGPCFIYPTPPIILTDPYPLQVSEMTHRAANFSNQIRKSRIHLCWIKMKIQLKSIPSNRTFTTEHRRRRSKASGRGEELAPGHSFDLWQWWGQPFRATCVSSSFRFDSNYPLLDGKAWSKLWKKVNSIDSFLSTSIQPRSPFLSVTNAARFVS